MDAYHWAVIFLLVLTTGYDRMTVPVHEVPILNGIAITLLFQIIVEQI